MTQEVNRSNEISLPLLGSILKEQRKNKGFTDTKNFASLIQKITGFPATKDMIYRIESGRQEPTITFLCAWSLTVYGHVFDYQIGKMISFCAIEKWENIDKETTKREQEKLLKEGYETF